MEEKIEELKGFIHFDNGELEPARRQFKKWLDTTLIDFYPKAEFLNKTKFMFMVGLVDLEERRIDSAEAHLNKLMSQIPQIDPRDKNWIEYYVDYLTSEIFLAKGSYDKAIARLNSTSLYKNFDYIYQDDNISYNSPFMKDGLAQSYEQNGELRKAIAEYEQLMIFHPDKRDNFYIHPKYHYRLAILYEQTGQKAKAIEHYEKFLSLWKDADPGIAEVEDARERLSNLKL
jgi:tetratricopeptide (TPR) repeat protein